MKTSRHLLIAATIILCGTVSVNTNAQTTSYYSTRHEVGVTVGAGSITEIFSGIADFTEIAISSVVSTVITGGAYTAHYTYGDESYIPTISAEYYYHVNNVIGLGGYVALNGMSRDMYFEWTDNNSGSRHKDKVGTAKRRNVSIIPTVKFDWLRKKYIGLYSKAGVGISILYETQKDDIDKPGATDYSSTDVIPNIELTFFGFEAGSQSWRGFAEYGLGEQGIICAGLRYKF